MSNLGAYQWITSTSKKVGGPVNLLLLTGAAGASLYKISEIGVKKCIKAFKAHRATQTKCLEDDENTYSVISLNTSNEGVEFPVGTKFKVLEIDGNSVLIEKIGEKDNPYFVSAEFLSTISNFQKE